MSTKDDVMQRFANIRGRVALAQAHRCPYNGGSEDIQVAFRTYQAAMAQICDADIGPIDDEAREGLELAALLPDEEPPPSPVAVITGVAVTYQAHDPARDCYLGYSAEQVAWGPHHGIPFIAPADGVVSLYTFPTPLPAAHIGIADPREYLAYLGQHQALFGGPFICGMPEADLLATSQTMYFVLYVPNSPLAGLRAMWFGHSRGNAKLGPVKTGEWFGESWDSGVRFESGGVPNARAAHVHCCASATGALTMNGDVDGLRAAAVMGWSVEFIGSNGPGPTQYQGGAYCAGRLLTDFTSGHHPIPPMPS